MSETHSFEDSLRRYRQTRMPLAMSWDDYNTAYALNEMFDRGVAAARQRFSDKYDEQARSAALQGFEKLSYAATNTAYAIRHMRLW